ncbi:MAG: TolC family protein [Loktanella sp.]|nr:TolC family protein [Loktanella sp.]MDO7627473.1 TolC family protein [Loktanella sp.]MDO7723007.1 TolC family protein [Loktanella sp.]MDO7729865.1 TolC family protein [Loktanella sp.]
MGDSAVSRSPVSMLGMSGPDGEAVSQAPASALDAEMENGGQSEIIQNLLNRRSVLDNGPFAQVANAVLAANSRAAEADLRAAKLRAEARANNWLPSIGPNVSLTSLGAVVSTMVVEQVLFDNGRKKAERDYAAADVEVAAVTLAQDTNKRVLAGLELYISAQEASARANVNAAAMERMEHYAYVMSERVKGGVSSRVDAQIVTQKLNQMQADMASDQETAAGALSELSAMTATPITGVSGISTLNDGNVDRTPLTVMKAQAESTRMIAEATAARAGFLPSLTAGGTLGNGGGIGLSVGSDNGLSLGTGAALGAIEEQKAAAAARVGQVQEDANRALRALEGELASLQRQETQAQSLATQASANFDIYSEQQKAGQRAVPDVVGIFETKVRAEREAVGIKYEIARVMLKIAALNGTLVNGEQI